MKLKIVKLYFKGPVSLMHRKKDEFVEEVSVFPSDKLKSALASAYYQLTGKDFENFWNKVKISSAFPFFSDKGKTVYFFPRPFSPTKIILKDKEDDPRMKKKIKKIKFLDNHLFKKAVNGEQVELEGETMNEIFPVGNAFAVSSENKDFLSGKTLFKSQTEEKIALGNISVLQTEAQATPFYVSRTYFDPEHSGLFFIYEGDTEVKDMLQKALYFLQDYGLGADKTFGGGHIKKCECSKLEIQTPEEPDGYLLLSKYIPEKNEVEHLRESYYNISKHKGFIASALHEKFRHWVKKAIWRIDEASVIVKHKPEGKNVKVVCDKTANKIGHNVYMDGRPLYIPLKLQENEETTG